MLPAKLEINGEILHNLINDYIRSKLQASFHINNSVYTAQATEPDCHADIFAHTITSESYFPFTSILRKYYRSKVQ